MTVIGSPTCTLAGALVCVTSPSASRFNAVSIVDELFAALVSTVRLATLTVLTIGTGPVNAAGTLNVAVMMRVAPAASVPSAHGNAVVQSPAFDTNVSPAGAGSSTTTAGAVDGPTFVTAIVEVSGVPGTANDG